MSTKLPANTKRTGKRKPTPSAWKKGQSGNPNGAPKRGESWREIWDKIGNLTPKEAAEHSRVIAAQIASIGDKVTLKEAVALRVYTSLLFEPSSGLLNAVMERTDGKVIQPIDITIWQRDYAEAIRQGTLTFAALELQFGPDGAAHILADIVSGGYMTADEVQERLNVKLLADGFFKQQVTLGSE